MAGASLSRRGLVVGLGGLGALGILGPRAAAAGETPPLPTFALRNARIVIGDGTEVSGGVRVERGVIVEVGPGVTTGDDLGGHVLHPGTWDTGCGVGLHEIDLEAETHDENESSSGEVPQARVIDSYNPLGVAVAVTRTYGVLGAMLLPRGGVMPGQAAWVRFTGTHAADATLLATAGVVIQLGHEGTGAQGGPKSRMGVAAKIRDLLDGAEDKTPGDADKKKKKKGAESEPEKETRQEKALKALRKKETKAIFVADRADDILLALDLAKEFQLDAVVLGAAEGHLVARDLRDTFVALGPITTQPDGWSHLHARSDNAKLLHDAGVRFAIRQGSSHQVRELGTEAVIAVAHGLPREVAVAAIMRNGPAHWGLPVGQIAVGAPATFARADGDPIQPRTRTLAAWYDGVPASMDSHQRRMVEKFKTLR